MENINQIPNIQPIESNQLVSPIKNQNRYKYLFFISLFLFLIILIFVCINYNSILKNKFENKTRIDSNNQTEKQESNTTTNVGDINKILDQINQQVKTTKGVLTVSKPEDSLARWINDDNQTITVRSALNLEIKITGQNATDPNKEIHRQVNKIIDNILRQNNFTLNKKNSSTSESDVQFDYIQAYEFGETKCVAISTINDGLISEGDNQLYSPFSFNCFTNTQYQKAFNEQKPFLDAYEKTKGISPTINNIEIQGNSARMSILADRSGHQAYMYKKNGQWTLIYEGQDNIGCDELKNNNVPVQDWPNCYNNDGTERKGVF